MEMLLCYHCHSEYALLVFSELLLTLLPFRDHLVSILEGVVVFSLPLLVWAISSICFLASHLSFSSLAVFVGPHVHFLALPTPELASGVNSMVVTS